MNKSKARRKPLRLPKKSSSHRTKFKDLLVFEKSLFAKGVRLVAGVDEVGRGCLAGPVFAAAVILPPDLVIPDVNDSKLLTAAVRERLYDEIRAKAISWAVASVPAEEIDRINIHKASLKAMHLAVLQLKPNAQYLLIDGRFLIPAKIAQQPIVRGDQRSQTVAAASIIAKVTRDRWMTDQVQKYPGFNFQRHKGYATEDHYAEIKKNGLTPLHRKSFQINC